MKLESFPYKICGGSFFREAAGGGIARCCWTLVSMLLKNIWFYLYNYEIIYINTDLPQSLGKGNSRSESGFEVNQGLQ